MTARDLVARRGAFVLRVPALDASPAGTAVLGPNGAGKTTLLLALQHLIPCDGAIQRAGRSAGVFAQPSVLRGSVRWNVAAAAGAVLGLTAHEADERAGRVLHAVGLRAFAAQDARSLSTGQRARLGLARALACEPALLVLDEPFANVDADARPALRDAVADYVASANCTLIVATGSLADATALCADALVLRAGEMAHAGPVRALASVRDPFVAALVAETTLRAS